MGPNDFLLEEKSVESINLDESKEEKLDEELANFKLELETKLDEIIFNTKEKQENLKSFLKKSFKKWEKTDLPEIFNFKTKINMYDCIEKIGRGSFGKVYLAKQIITGTSVALKAISKKSLKKKDAESKVIKEIDILKRIPSHPNVIKLFEVFSDENFYYLVFEYAELGDLISYFYKNELFEGMLLKKFVFSILEGLNHIHNYQIIHRDIKPDNILMNKDFSPKIADFGISNIYKEGEKIKDTGGTPMYLAPEVIEEEGKIGYKTDIWSTGIVVYLLTFGETPFKGKDINQLFLEILNKYDYNFDNKDADLKDLIDKMLQKKIEERIELSDLLNHPWFDSLKYPQDALFSGSGSNSEFQDIYRKPIEEVDEDGNNFEETTSFITNKQTKVKRMVNSCREIGTKKIQNNLSNIYEKPKPDFIFQMNQKINSNNQTFESPTNKKFVNKTSTKNTNKNTASNAKNKSEYKESHSNYLQKEEIKRNIILSYLENFGFPKQYLEHSIDPERKLFNHARACFESLIILL